MTSDVRDVLNLNDGHAGPRPSKKQKLSAPRPNLKGLAREVQNLGGDNPIAIVPQVPQFKKRRLANRKPAAHWELRQFRNSGRDDPDFLLRHWRRAEAKQTEGTDAQGPVQESAQEQSEQQEEKPPKDEIEDSTFTKYNVQVSVPQYSEDQYQQSLQNADWSKQETDYLMDLARDLDLRWPLIWDRYEWNPPATNGNEDADGDESKAIVPTTQTRSMEDLKARYYEVASKMMAAQKPVQYMTQPEFALHELMSHFSPAQEKARKEWAISSLARSPEEAKEEESLLLEIKRILARGEKFNEERTELYTRLDYPHTETDVSTFKSSNGLQSLLQTLMSADKSKKRKSLVGTDGMSPVGPPGALQNPNQEGGRRESNAGSAHRDSIGAATTPVTGSKKGQQPQPERRKLTEHEEAIYGVTHHDRLGSGPTFRTEKINKLFSHKSNQQQLRINNTLNELDVPAKLAMPTAATTHAYELLLGAVNSLLDARKVTDKIDAEIKVEQAKKSEREKALAPPETEGQAEKTEEGTESAGNIADESVVTNGEDANASQVNASQAGDGDEAGEGEDGNEDGDEDEAAETPKAEDEADLADEEEDNAEQGGRPGSSGAHKRSASVLSSMSDKSAKRQKK